MRLSPPKSKCSLKLSLELFLTLYTHQALDAAVETQGLGAEPPPFQKIYNFLLFIKTRTIK